MSHSVTNTGISNRENGISSLTEVESVSNVDSVLQRANSTNRACRNFKSPEMETISTCSTSDGNLDRTKSYSVLGLSREKTSSSKSSTVSSHNESMAEKRKQILHDTLQNSKRVTNHQAKVKMIQVQRMREESEEGVKEIKQLVKSLSEDRRWKCIFDVISPKPAAPSRELLQKAISHAIIKRPDMLRTLEPYITDLEYYEDSVNTALHSLHRSKSKSVSGSGKSRSKASSVMKSRQFSDYCPTDYTLPLKSSGMKVMCKNPEALSMKSKRAQSDVGELNEIESKRVQNVDLDTYNAESNRTQSGVKEMSNVVSNCDQNVVDEMYNEIAAYDSEAENEQIASKEDKKGTEQ